MRSKQEMFDLILGVAEDDDRIRAVIMNGSRTSPSATPDIFQDYDVVYLVTEVSSFRDDPAWPERFGELMIMQRPDEMGDSPAQKEDRYAYLMQFADGNRIDLTLYPLAKLNEMERDSQSILLLDKDGIIEPFPPPSDDDYLPEPPTAKAFADSSNEFWWVSAYVAKGLWREEILYAKSMMEYVRVQLMKMLAWYLGIKTDFSSSLGKSGRYFEEYLEEDLWDLLLGTYSDGDYGHTWDALETMGHLFRITSRAVAEHFDFEYPLEEDRKVSAHLCHVRELPKNVEEMY